MIGFALVALCYLAGSRLADALEQRGKSAGLARGLRFGAAVAGGAAGILVWRATDPGGVFGLILNVSDALHKPLGPFGDLVAAALFVIILLAIGVGILVSAITVTGLLASALAIVIGLRGDSRNLGHGDPGGHDLPSRPRPAGAAVTSRREWHAAVSRYGRDVAAAVDAQLPGPDGVEIRFCGQHPEHLHLAADGVLADWDVFEGWSAMTLRGRHWYGVALVPSPETIARWLRDVGTQPHLGSGRPREWYNTDEADSIQQAQQNALTQLAALARPRHRPAQLSTMGASEAPARD